MPINDHPFKRTVSCHKGDSLSTQYIAKTFCSVLFYPQRSRQNILESTHITHLFYVNNTVRLKNEISTLCMLKSC